MPLMNWDSFLSDFWPNLAATVVGVTLGIPIGLWTNRKMIAHEKQTQDAEDRARFRTGLEEVLAILRANAFNAEVTVCILRDEVVEDVPPDPKLDSTAWEAYRSDVASMLRDPRLHVRLALYFERVALAKRLAEPLMLHALESEVATEDSSAKTRMMRKGLAMLLSDIKTDGELLIDAIGKKLESFRHPERRR